MGCSPRRPLLALACALLVRGRELTPTTLPPAGHGRAWSSYDWCDCRTGLANVTIWAGDDRLTLAVGPATAFVALDAATTELRWRCDGMARAQRASAPAATRVWGARFSSETKTPLCGAASGRLAWTGWAANDNVLSVPFVSGGDGYACTKIPSLLRLASGAFLAFAEARWPDCGDFSRTDLVAKRSEDGGKTWSAAQVVAPAAPGTRGLCGHEVVVGNAAPVQATKGPRAGRVLVPHTRDNFAVWSVHSDDDGRTWSAPRALPGLADTDAAGPDCNRTMAYFGVNTTASVAAWVEAIARGDGDPYREWGSKLAGPWQFLGLGPPGALELDDGRLIAPGYHAYIRGLDGGGGAGAGVDLPVSQLYNNLALGHVVYSDDGGDSWALASRRGFGGGAAGGSHGANEMQLVQLRNGSLLANSRSLSTGSRQARLAARSDDRGLTWTPSSFVDALPEPFNGCQGSLARSPRALYFSHPDPLPNDAALPRALRGLGGGVNLTGRDHLTLWASRDEGDTWDVRGVVDAGTAGYSSLAVVGGEHCDAVYVLYEQADPAAASLAAASAAAVVGGLAVLNPDRLVLYEEAACG